MRTSDVHKHALCSARMDAFNGLLRDALVVCALLSLPVLAVATLVGTVVAVVQAATQVQEQTLTMLPKLIAVGVVIAVFGTVALRLCQTLFYAGIDAIPHLVGS